MFLKWLLERKLFEEKFETGILDAFPADVQLKLIEPVVNDIHAKGSKLLTRL